MKKLVFNLFTFAAIGLAVVSCKNENKAETSDAKEVKEVVASANYKAVPESSMIMWRANKVVGGHEGTINVSEGVAKLEGDQLVGGNFVFDINTINPTDIPADDENHGKLTGHLKNADFFDVEKHDTATFEITNVEGNNISGNLTMKGITKNVTFPANISVNGDELNITSDKFTIDRTEWGIEYNSGKVMDAAKLGDYLIKDDVVLQVKVKADKA